MSLVEICLTRTARERLEQSRSTAKEESQRMGFELGVAWAQEQAEYRTLRRIGTCHGWSDVFADDDVSDSFFEAMQGHSDREWCPEFSDEAWTEWFGEAALMAQHDPDMLVGFVDGVTSTYITFAFSD